MYHPDVVAKRIFQARKAGIPIMKRSREESLEISSKLEKLRYKNGVKLPPGQLVRDLDAKELTFTRSERALCKADFIYYLIRYHTIERDPGVGSESGVGPATLLESQVRFITMLGRRELVCHEEQKRFGHTQGIRVYAHKCRQVVFTTTCRALCNHRRLFYPGTRSLAAALTDGPKGTGELYKRDLLNIDNLPFWLKPDEIYPNVKDEEIGFPALLTAVSLIKLRINRWVSELEVRWMSATLPKSPCGHTPTVYGSLFYLPYPKLSLPSIFRRLQVLARAVIGRR
jgi:hypothetical protein